MRKNIVQIEVDKLAPIIEETVAAGETIRITVVGNSMYPIFRSGRDSVILTKAGVLKKGDIPFYRRTDGRYVLHRIIDRKDDVFTMCGDNQTEPEFPVMLSQICAKVDGFYRDDRYISCGNWFYRIYSWVWRVCFKQRPFMTRVINIMKRIKRTFAK